jgi:hypothetical protein
MPDEAGCDSLTGGQEFINKPTRFKYGDETMDTRQEKLSGYTKTDYDGQGNLIKSDVYNFETKEMTRTTASGSTEFYTFEMPSGKLTRSSKKDDSNI